MSARLNRWDYLIVTASNTAQAAAYEARLDLRLRLGLLGDVGSVIVVPDPEGRRIGSGGSTLLCLMEVLSRELGGDFAGSDGETWLSGLKDLRILILHAGGDSRRLPAYGPCGKIFVPVPGECDRVLPLTLFDRQLETYLSLPDSPDGAGRVVITSGDVLLRFDPADVRFAANGVTGLACYSPPEQAARHGVFCRGHDDAVRLYLQKPSIQEQNDKGALDAYDQACLDIGVMSFDVATAVRMLTTFGACAETDGGCALKGPMGEGVMEWGLDFYREICCAMGVESSPEHHCRSAQESGSKWDAQSLGGLYEAFESVPFHVRLLKHCDFMDFGTSGALIANGTRLLQEDRGAMLLQRFVDINNEVAADGVVAGAASWIEGCRIGAAVTLGGQNVVVGIDVDEPLAVEPRGCLDVIEGGDKEGAKVWFVRCYGVDDTFKAPIDEGAIFCNMELSTWLKAVGAKAVDIWDEETPPGERTLWNARLFPAVKEHQEYRQWLWMHTPGKAKKKDCQAWRKAERYSLEEILAAADQEAFHRRRRQIRTALVRGSLRSIFRPDSEFSSSELAYMLSEAAEPVQCVADVLREALWHAQSTADQTYCFVFPRIMHTLGSAVEQLFEGSHAKLSKALPGLKEVLAEQDVHALKSLGVIGDEDVPVVQWVRSLQRCAFEQLERTIIGSGSHDKAQAAQSALRSDEIVWARIPARLDLGGGWTDTPPYSLERGGCVVNAGVNLNGQPPIQAYLRVIDEPVIRLASIDLGVRIEITDFDELLNYRNATGSFALAEAALVLSGIAPSSPGDSLQATLRQFGGGIELTTLAAIPKGSGLGTSSIMGAVIVAAVQRAMGRQIFHRDLFHSVLRLEQALTTGGGWQDQIGGVVDDVKMIATEPGMVPDARIHYVPADVLDPCANGGLSLLYYTGVTRLAKDILQQVVGRYLDRDRGNLWTLAKIRSSVDQVAEALTCKDLVRFGRLIDRAWQLNKQLDPNSTNAQIDALLECVAPHIHGAKLLGAGGGGFMLMICRSAQDAAAVREMLESDPPNDRARFFDFDISKKGLVVTVC